MRAVQVFAVVAGALLLAGLWAAPHLPPLALLPISIGWLAVLVAVVALTTRVVARRWGTAVGAIGLLLAVTASILPTAVDWPPSLSWMPCRRNWKWLPSYLLRSSPTRSVSFVVGTSEVKVCYGAPRARGRRMIGGSPVPFGQLWRTGANEPTTVRSTGPVSIAGIAVPAGRHSLYTIPGPETWEVIVNRSTSQWGIESEYSDRVRASEIGRAVVASKRRPHHVEVLTIGAETSGTGGLDLVIQWETTEVRLPVAIPRF
jgi:hypothetical protein